MTTFENVRKSALALPNVEDGLSYGAPALKVGGTLIIRLREDLNAIVVLTTFEEREEMMAADPKMYYITDHYLNYPYVLVSLENVHEDALTDLVRAAHRLAKGKKASRA
jgi:hypothetical protein